MKVVFNFRGRAGLHRGRGPAKTVFAAARATLLAAAPATPLAAAPAALLVAARATLLVAARATLLVAARATLLVAARATLLVAARATLLAAAPAALLALATTAAALSLAGCRTDNPYALATDEVTAQQRLEKLGRALFFDESLSSPPGESCATCHAPAAAFTDPRGGLPTSRGATASLAGVRNTPTAMYAAFVPPLHYANADDGFSGGLFLDGRADSLEAQAHGPFLNPIEMGNADAHALVARLRAASYADLFRSAFGNGALDDDAAAFDAAAHALAAFERTPALAPFSSKYDAYLAGRAALTPAEARGLLLFNDEKKGNCAACHPSAPSDDGAPPLFTDFTYDNLGIPRNPANPFYALPAAYNRDGAQYLDRGLGATLADAAWDGKFRVPTLRNVALTAPYGHNGYFADLRSVVDFYNTRDTRPWPAPEVASTMNRDELGHLGLSDGEIDDLVTFLYTLTDGWTP